MSTPTCFVTPTTAVVVFPGESVANAEPIEAPDCPASSVPWIVEEVPDDVLPIDDLLHLTERVGTILSATRRFEPGG